MKVSWSYGIRPYKILVTEKDVQGSLVVKLSWLALNSFMVWRLCIMTNNISKTIHKEPFCAVGGQRRANLILQALKEMTKDVDEILFYDIIVKEAAKHKFIEFYPEIRKDLTVKLSKSIFRYMGTSKFLKHIIQLASRIIMAQYALKHWMLSQYPSKQDLINRVSKSF